MVCLVTDDIKKKKLQPTCGHVKKQKQLLALRATNRLQIPYMGYLKLEMRVLNCRVLVLKDTPATSRQRKDVPGFLLEAGSRVPAPVYFEQSTRLLKVWN